MTYKVTQELNEIKAWAEKYGGKPQIMTLPNTSQEKVGLRIDFPGDQDDEFLSSGGKYEYVDWDEFFDHFNNQNLAFQYWDEDELASPDWRYYFIKSYEL